MVTAVPAPSRASIEQLLALTTHQGSTVRLYLAELLAALWMGSASAKYGMTGESDWQFDIYEPMREAGLIPQWRDGYGPEGEVRQAADRLICAAIMTFNGEWPA